MTSPLRLNKSQSIACAMLGLVLGTWQTLLGASAPEKKAAALPAAHTAAALAPRLSLPARPSQASGGTEFLKKSKRLSLAAREEAILKAIQTGNVPEFLRQLVPVSFATRIGGRQVEATIFVTSDYMAIGSAEDYVRIPLALPTAIAVAAELQMLLPTKKVVDILHRNAKLQVSPSPLPPGRKMMTSGYFAKHNKIIKEQCEASEMGELIAGHKKDIVLSNRLIQANKRIAIYGWHRQDGKAIQPLSTVHGARYVDYSHGLRLMSATMLIDGKPRAVRDVLADKRWAGLLSDEGPVDMDAILQACAQGDAGRRG